MKKLRPNKTVSNNATDKLIRKFKPKWGVPGKVPVSVFKAS